MQTLTFCSGEQGVQRGVREVSRGVRAVPERRAVPCGRGRGGGQCLEQVPELPRVLTGTDVRDRDMPAHQGQGVHALHWSVRGRTVCRAAMQPDGGHGVRRVYAEVCARAVQAEDRAVSRGGERGGCGAGELCRVPDSGRVSGRDIPGEQLHGDRDHEERVQGVQLGPGVQERVLRGRMWRVQRHQVPGAPGMSSGAVSGRLQLQQARGMSGMPQLCE